MTVPLFDENLLMSFKTLF